MSPNAPGTVGTNVPERLHRRQYVIGPTPVSPHADWRHVTLSEGVVLSHCPSLPVAAAADREGTVRCLLGHVAEGDERRPSPIEQIMSSDGDDLVQLPASWAGRWLLVGAADVTPDPSALLSCFYVSGGPWVSSSPALLEQCAAARPRDEASVHEGRMNWVAPPATMHRGVRRLLPSQTLRLPSCSPEPRPIVGRGRGDRTGSDAYDAVLDRLAERLTTSMRRAAHGFERVWVPLSAGYDSRLVLALALAAGLPVQTFTFRKRNEWRRTKREAPLTSYTLAADMTLPPRIAALAKVPHRWIEPAPFRKERLTLFDRHSAGYTHENDRAYFSHEQWSWAGQGDIVLRGGAFEVGHCFYWDRFPGEERLGTAPPLKPLLDQWQPGPDSPQAEGLAAWVEWASAHPEPRLDWRDRMYVEQRVAGWLASLEQALDLVPGERYYPVNAAETFELLVSVPAEMRQARRHHLDLIERLAPELLGLPFNPPEPRARRWTYRVLTKVDQLAHMHPGDALANVASIARRFVSRLRGSS